MSKNEKIFIAVTSFGVAAILVFINLDILMTYGLSKPRLYFAYFKNYINLLIPAIGFIGVGIFLLIHKPKK